MNVQQTISPVDGSVYAERPFADRQLIDAVFDTSGGGAARLGGAQRRGPGGVLQPVLRRAAEP